MNYEEKARARFMWYVEKNENGCWIWIGGKKTDKKWRNKGGLTYGQFCYIGKTRRAHRAAYLMFVGEIPDQMFVLHNCDNSLCVNPEHLRLGTHQENMDDMVKRGRAKAGGFIRSKLTDEQVMAIREEKRGSTVLGRIYGVTPENIRCIKRGITWKHLL